jgi:hypothetical protein
MKPISLLLLSCVAIASCGGNDPVQPSIGAPAVESAAFAKAPAPQPVYTCASADIVLGSLITFVRNATHVQAPATEAVLLPPLRAAHVALVTTPCDKQGALAAMAEFNATVDATASTVSAAQVTMFHAIANRIVSTINLVR